MLQALQRIAVRLRPVQPALAALGALSLAVCIALVLLNDARLDSLLHLGVLLLLWSLCGYILVQTFAEVPPPPGPELTGLRRLKRRLARAWLWLLALLFVGVTLAALLLTSRLVRELLG